MGDIVWPLTWAGIGISFIWITLRMFDRIADRLDRIADRLDRIEGALAEEDEDAPDPAEW